MYPYIELFDHSKIPSYILMISLAFSIAVVWAYKKSKKLKYKTSFALDLSLVIMISGFIGGRAFHVFYEEPTYYFNHPENILKFWQGGFVFYGGLLTVLIVTFIFCRLHKRSYLFWADFFAPFGAFGYSLGRVGCFLNGCCYGDLCDLPWAVVFPKLLPHGLARHPTQLYASVLELLILFALLFFEKHKTFRYRGQLFCVWIFLHGCNRITMELFRADPRGDQIFDLSVSTLISLFLITASLSGFLFIQKKSDKKRKQLQN